MFTGIVQGIGTIIHVKASPSLTRYTVAFPEKLVFGLEQGASISVHGVCQTVVAIHDQQVQFDAIQETLQRTTLGNLAVGQNVNLERSAKIGDEIGGHLLSGHIMGMGTIAGLDTLSDEQKILTLQCDPIFIKYIFSKGYIALNGASLTVVDVDPKGHFTVHLIPETLRATTFGKAQLGEKVNIEIDSQTQVTVESVERILYTKQISSYSK